MPHAARIMPQPSALSAVHSKALRLTLRFVYIFGKHGWRSISKSDSLHAELQLANFVVFLAGAMMRPCDPSHASRNILCRLPKGISKPPSSMLFWMFSWMKIPTQWVTLIKKNNILKHIPRIIISRAFMKPFLILCSGKGI